MLIIHGIETNKPEAIIEKPDPAATPMKKHGAFSTSLL